MIKERGRRSLLTALLALLILLPPAQAYAEVKYNTYTKNSSGSLVWLQPAFIPVDVIGEDLYAPDPANLSSRIVSSMQHPKDLFIDASDHIYIADTGNNRIIHLDAGGKLVRYLTVPDNPLNKPEGVFVTDEGEIFVADTGNRRIVKLDKDGNVLDTFEKPSSPYISSTFVFTPVKLIVDKRGYLYVASQGSYEGLLVLEPDGNLQGYFGTNSTVLSAMDALKKWLYTEEMYAREVQKRPETINSLATDEGGFIYTVTGGSATENQLKKLNSRGDNMLRSSQGSFGEFRDIDAARLPKTAVKTPQLIDVAADSDGNIVVVDQQYKYISHYDSNGNLLYFWGGPSSTGTSQVGLMKSPVALDFNSRNELYILDDQENVIQKFRLSEFGRKVAEANKLTLQGFYEESEKLWREVLRLNAEFAPAIEGLAQAAYKKEQYDEARQLFEAAGNQAGYSEAFWEIRLQWFQANFSWIATLVLVVFVLVVLSDKWPTAKKLRAKWRNRKRSQHPVILHFRHAFYILRHPVDGFTAIRYEGKGTYWSAAAIIIGVYVALLIREFATSFSFQLKGYVNIYTVFTQFFVVWITWVIANYLVSSIYRGEGRFRDVFIGSAYALFPCILVGIPLALLSNVMTQSEMSIYNFASDGMFVWIALLIFWNTQWIHNYSVGETLINIALTLVTMVVIGILVFIIMGLTSDLLSFLYEIYREVTLR
ncbi:YIP1 family protein [Paenibacillus cisolokensis]|uniref:YIP1 family protein n=1 Tax=Paenibacillus cisolokensis TaxID=1658519 RepID=UPI003D2E5A92